MATDALIIPASNALDPITVIFQDLEPRKGRIIVLCYGEAWTAYWNAMPQETVREFVVNMDAAYLENKLTSQRDTKKWQKYLGRIVANIKAELPRGEVQHGE